MNPQNHSVAPEDFRRLFESSPAQYVVVNREFRIVAATDSVLEAGGRRREDIVGLLITDAYPDNPDNPDANGTEVLRSALQRVLDERTGHVLPIQRYDIEVDGIFEERYFKPLNEPVLSADGEVEYIIHGVENVTESVKATQAS
ncbi:PAS domain-containing protein [Pseudarthrobacter sp. O4]|uniref:PAS domain-containing protein n=1 Tax=Pseudarthrobacter sp. O4 TaxID=3418417 RepID=UPI003CEF0748